MGTTLDESARRAGAHHWAESRLFEVLGAWVATTPEPEIRLLLDLHSHHCSWRAAQWWDRLPVLADVDRASLSSAPTEAAARAMGDLAVLPGTVSRLAGAYRVALPRLWTAYEEHRGRAGPLADGSTLRTLGIVMPDISSDWHAGESALQALLPDAAAAREAAAAVVALEEILAGD